MDVLCRFFKEKNPGYIVLGGQVVSFLFRKNIVLGGYTVLFKKNVDIVICTHIMYTVSMM